MLVNSVFQLGDVILFESRNDCIEHIACQVYGAFDDGEEVTTDDAAESVFGRAQWGNLKCLKLELTKKAHDALELLVEQGKAKKSDGIYTIKKNPTKWRDFTFRGRFRTAILAALQAA